MDVSLSQFLSGAGALLAVGGAWALIKSKTADNSDGIKSIKRLLFNNNGGQIYMSRSDCEKHEKTVQDSIEAIEKKHDAFREATTTNFQTVILALGRIEGKIEK
jgi:hypothetical protein